MTTLTIDHVYKSFDKVEAVKDLSLELPEGVIFGLLGPNGAGKTTTIRMIMNIIIPDKGNISILGKPNSMNILDQVGYLPEERGFYRKMKVGDILNFMGELKGLSHAEAKQIVSQWLERLEITEWLNKKVEELSKGMQQKLLFIATILHQPKLIILDEPFSGLDPINTDLVKNIMIEQKNAGVTIIFSTHQMEQVEKLCDSICLIDKGSPVLSGELKKIKKEFSRNTFRLEYTGQAKFLENPRFVKKYKRDGDAVEIYPAEKMTPQQMLQVAMRDVEIIRFELTEPSLHEIFIDTVTAE